MPKQKYSPALKQEVLELVLHSDASTASISRDYGIPANTLYQWVSKHQLAHGEHLPKKPNESLEQEVKRLRKSLLIAQQERDILKKATAYFAALDRQSTPG